MTFGENLSRDGQSVIEQRGRQHRDFGFEPFTVGSFEDAEVQFANRLPVGPQSSQPADRQRGHHHQHQGEPHDQLAPNRSGQDHRDLLVHGRRGGIAARVYHPVKGGGKRSAAAAERSCRITGSRTIIPPCTETLEPGS